MSFNNELQKLTASLEDVNLYTGEMSNNGIPGQAYRFAPEFRLHPQEQWMPCSIEWYLHKCTLLDGIRIVEYHVTQETLTQYKDQTNYQLYFNPEYTNGQPYASQVPVYVGITKKGGFTYFQYCVLFAYNGPSKVCHTCLEGGEHFTDIEHVTVKVNNATQKVDSVYFGAHRSKDGVWKKADDMQFSNTGSPIVYVALGSHAMYPKPGNYYRIFGATHDECSAAGQKWNPIPLEITDNTPWNAFRGFLGQPKENHSPKYHDWWHANDPETSANWFTRLFCFCT
jgi:hypothetical protein